MRVAITTAEDRFDGVAPVFIDQGLEPVRIPCIRIRPEPEDVLASVRDEIAAVGRTMASSARAIEVLWPRLDAPASDFYVVGPVTADAVEQCGGFVRVEGADGLADLVRSLVPLDLSRLVFPHADGTDLDVLEPMRATGVDVLNRMVYRTQRIEPGTAAVDAVAFASPSAVDGWLSSRTLDGVIVAAIGTTTAAAIVRRGVRVDVVPPRPGHAELAASLAAISNGRAS